MNFKNSENSKSYGFKKKVQIMAPILISGCDKASAILNNKKKK